MNQNDLMLAPIGATPLVLSHSLATNLEKWDEVLPMLENDFRVIRYDARGHDGTVPSIAHVGRLGVDANDDAQHQIF